MKKTLILMVASSLLVACGPQSSDPVVVTAEPPMDSAEEFVARVNDELIDLNREGGAASWIRATYITEDTAIISSLADEKYAEWHSRTVKQAAMYDGQELAPATRRALDQLKLGTSLPAPDDADKRKELARLATDLRGMYGAGQYCRSDDDCMSLQDIENTIADSRDFEQLNEAWVGWRTISPPMPATRQALRSKVFAEPFRPRRWQRAGGLPRTAGAERRRGCHARLLGQAPRESRRRR